jgi:hypothetical protein
MIDGKGISNIDNMIDARNRKHETHQKISERSRTWQFTVNSVLYVVLRANT